MGGFYILRNMIVNQKEKPSRIDVAWRQEVYFPAAVIDSVAVSLDRSWANIHFSDDLIDSIYWYKLYGAMADALNTGHLALTEAATKKRRDVFISGVKQNIDLLGGLNDSGEIVLQKSGLYIVTPCLEWGMGLTIRSASIRLEQTKQLSKLHSFLQGNCPKKMEECLVKVSESFSSLRGQITRIPAHLSDNI